MRASRGLREWLTAATQPRLLGILVVLVIGALVCVRLGAWQLDRAELRGQQEREVERAEQASADPVPLADVVAPQTRFTQAMVATRVSVSGTYDVGEQFFVPGRVLEGRTGFLVVTGLRVTGGGADGAILPVVRGWAPTADPAYLDAVPAGEVDVMGYLAGSEAASSRSADSGVLEGVSSAQLVNIWGSPMYSGHVVLAEQSPRPGTPPGLPAMEPMSPPVVEGGGLNLQNLAYAGEWFIFGGFALFLWWRMVRDEVRHRRGEPAPARGPDGSGPGQAPQGRPGPDHETTTARHERLARR